MMNILIPWISCGSLVSCGQSLLSSCKNITTKFPWPRERLKIFKTMLKPLHWCLVLNPSCENEINLHVNETFNYVKGWGQGLALEKRPKIICKWAIADNFNIIVLATTKNRKRLWLVLQSENSPNIGYQKQYKYGWQWF